MLLLCLAWFPAAAVKADVVVIPGGGWGGPPLRRVARPPQLLLRTLAGKAVHVSVPPTSLVLNPHLRLFSWSFGDAGSAYNALNGFNAAHVYERPGIYPITLNGGVYAQVIVSPAAAPKTVSGQAELRSILRAGGAARLPPGVTTLDATIITAPGATLVGSPGGSSQLLWTGLPRKAMIGAYDGGLTVRDVTFASVATTGFEKNCPDAVGLGGPDSLVLRCRFVNITTAVNGNGRPDGVLVQDCSVNGDGDLRAYFVWAEGRRWTILGNRVPNSTRETPVRLSAVGDAPNCAFALIAHNTLANIARPLVDPVDEVKSAVRCEFVDYGWVENNEFIGLSDAGPLGGPDGNPPSPRRANYLVWRNNVHRGPVRLKSGLQHFLMQDSRVDYLAGSVGGYPVGIAIEGYDPLHNRASADLLLRHNVLTTPRRGERQVWVTGPVRQRLEFAQNTLAQAAAMVIKPGKSSIGIDGGWQPGYASHDNVFPAAGTHGWPNPLAVAQVGDQNQPASYLTIPQWLALPNVARDSFVNVPVP